ncbi:MAG: hypothetical protein AAFQ20_13695, partial [Bacteroidota bacterium]
QLYYIHINYLRVSGILQMFTLNPKCFFFLLLLLLLVRFPAKAQSDIQEKIDSLESFLKENPSRVFINYDIAELYRRKDTALAFQNVRKGLEAAIKENNLYGVGKGKFLLLILMYLNHGNVPNRIILGTFLL